MTLEDADDLVSLAEELERHALTHEKVIQHLDLARARRLRDLSARAREVLGRGARPAERETLERDILALRLEAMVALLSAPAKEPTPAPSRAVAGAGGRRATPAPGPAPGARPAPGLAVPIGRMKPRSR